MHKPNRLYALTLVWLLAAGLQGCASFGKCDPESCTGDKKITADVYAMIKEHREFGAPGTIRVQTINGVVYLNGLVETDFERRSAESLVMQVANVKDVVNSLDVRNSAR
ncbi:MAG TPA: BON domain-containing protein [Steroidobacteraceae bacterium]|jgi:osmotically-inducible protein OsmY|nr:BON domain-containing protein [Steroidobacteraceae bacterium]